jgi:membrane fusion protein, multidrug efflux system
MAASARDQAARDIRSESDVFKEETSHAALVSDDEHLRLEPSEKPEAHRIAKMASSAKESVFLASGNRRKILIGLGAALALTLIYFGAHYLLVGRYMISTDDAYVRANNTVLGVRVAGHIARIVVGDNTQLKAGDLIFQIDDGDYRIAVDAARAKIATQEVTIERIARQVTAQQSAVEQAQAQLVSAEVATKRAESDFIRQQSLSDKGFASRAIFDVSQAGRDQAIAAVKGAQATLDAAQAQIDVVKAQQAEARGQLAELKTVLAKAERDLSFTRILAPVDGVFSNRLVNAGDYIQPGQRLANVVPLNDVYIDANYKETQLGRLKPGQPVTITVDAMSGRTIDGVVDSIAPASGSVFTLLPPDNATGNFTKIVQRVPVRIRVPVSVSKENLLRAGMSVVTTINTKEAGH